MEKNDVKGVLAKANTTYQQAQDLMSLLPNYYQWISRQFSIRVGGQVLEIGAGAGHMVGNYLASADHAFVLDHDPLLLDSIRRKFDENRVTVLDTDLRSDWEKALKERFDTALALDVLEHFQDDLALACKVSSALKREGLFVVKVPANSDLYGAADQASGHYRRYDPEQLHQLLVEAGLRKVSMVYFNRIGSIVYKFKKNEKRNFSKNFKPWFLKFINSCIPLISLLDRFIPGKGLSIIAVYQKP